MTRTSSGKSKANRKKTAGSSDKGHPKIPVNTDGFADMAYLREFHEGRSVRSRDMDNSRVATTVFAPQVTEAQARTWMSRPGRYDIDGIDAPPGTANVPVGGFPRKKTVKKKALEGTEYPQSFWDSLPWDTDPVYAMRMASMAMEVEKMGYHDDMRALLEDDDYGEIASDGRWKTNDRAAAEAFYRKKMDEFFTYGNANVKSGRIPFTWYTEGRSTYTIGDSAGNLITVTNRGGSWIVNADVWDVPAMKFKTSLDAKHYAEFLMGAGA